MANNTNYKIEPAVDVNGHPCMLVSWQGQGTPTKIRLGITNNNNFNGYGYGISYGSNMRVSDGAWGSGPLGVTQTSAPAAGGISLPVYITPCYLTAPTTPAPQGITWFNSIAPSSAGPFAVFQKDGNSNAGITIVIQDGGSGGGDDDE